MKIIYTLIMHKSQTDFLEWVMPILKKNPNKTLKRKMAINHFESYKHIYRSDMKNELNKIRKTYLPFYLIKDFKYKKND